MEIEPITNPKELVERVAAVRERVNTTDVAQIARQSGEGNTQVQVGKVEIYIGGNQPQESAISDARSGVKEFNPKTDEWIGGPYWGR